MEYRILSYQVVYTTGERDIVKIPQHRQPKVKDLNKFRKNKKVQHNCMSVNLTYQEVHEQDDISGIL